jgi:hypothetical protein
MKNLLQGLIFAALFSVQSAFAITPENGWWWNPAESGRGFNIETQDRTVFIATFVYQNNGSPIWYSGSGQLNASSTVTANLQRSDGGQCIGCPHTSPTTSNGAGPITVRFTSPSTGVVTWSGGTTNIERFNFALGNNLEQLLGEWVLTQGDPSFPVYFGERLTFTSIESNGAANGNRISANGARTGTTRLLMAAPFDAPVKGYWYFAMLDSSTDYNAQFLFNLVGLNKIEGIYAVTDKSDTQDEQAKQLLNGTYFVGYRYQGKSDAQGTVTAQSTVRAQSVEHTQPSWPNPHAQNDQVSYAIQSQKQNRPVDSNDISAIISKMMQQ